MSTDEYVEIVAPTEPDLADELFRAWLADRAASPELTADDIRIDVIRALDGGTLKRYRVRAEALRPTH